MLEHLTMLQSNYSINKIVPAEYFSAFDRWNVKTKGRSILTPKYVPETRCLYTVIPRLTSDPANEFFG